MYNYEAVSVLEGKILTNIQNNGDELIFEVNDGTRYRMFHYQD